MRVQGNESICEVRGSCGIQPVSVMEIHVSNVALAR